MNIPEIIKILFGTTIITAIAAILAIAGNFFNIRDRFKKWRDEKKKAKYKKAYQVENPDFKFTLHYVSNPTQNKCILSAMVLNVSKEIKYFDSISYNFHVMGNMNRYEPPVLFADGEKWPKRLEHGERFSVSVNFYSSIVNSLFQYWKRGVHVYATCQSTTGDLLRSNSIDFDRLVNYIEPLNEGYRNLAVLLSQKTEGPQREIEVSLWQLQIFGRLTSNIGKQLQQSNIPIVQYLIDKHGFILKQDLWYHWDKELWEKKIDPPIIEEFLRNII